MECDAPEEKNVFCMTTILGRSYCGRSCSEGSILICTSGVTKSDLFFKHKSLNVFIAEQFTLGKRIDDACCRNDSSGISVDLLIRLTPSHRR